MRRLALAVALAVALTADAASASHFQTSFFVSPTTPGVPAAGDYWADFGNHAPAALTLHFPSAHGVNEEGGTGAPLEGEQVAKGTVRGRVALLFCATTTFTVSVYWDDLDNTTSEPPGAVARLRFVPALGNAFDGYVVRRNASDTYQTGAHSDIVISPTGLSGVFCSTPDVEWTLATYATTASGAWFLRNPSSAGTYTLWSEYSDTGGGVHDDAASYLVM